MPKTVKLGARPAASFRAARRNAWRKNKLIWRTGRVMLGRSPGARVWGHVSLAEHLAHACTGAG